MNSAGPDFQSYAVFGLNWARLKRTVRLGLKSLWLHRLRSLLTALGIVFGVCSVIAMLAIGEGASHEAQEQIKNLGNQAFSVQQLLFDLDNAALETVPTISGSPLGSVSFANTPGGVQVSGVSSFVE